MVKKMKNPRAAAQVRLREDLIREFILDRSEDLFMAHGYLKTSMDMIAEGSGLSKPTLYHYFKNKYELFTSLYVRLYAGLHETLAGFLRQKLDRRQALEGFVDHYLLLMTSKKEFLKMYFRDQHLVIHENIEEHMTWHVQSRKLMEDLLADVLKDLVRPEVRRRFGAVLVASTVFDLLEGAVADLILHGDQEPAEVKRFILELLGRGVLRENP